MKYKDIVIKDLKSFINTNMQGNGPQNYVPIETQLGGFQLIPPNEIDGANKKRYFE
jgi:hypothetical protein